MNATARPSWAAPLVTTIIPTYNGAEHLAETIQSILDQDHPAVEVLVVVDGSTDDTSAVLEGFGDRVRVVAQPNRGQATAVNSGLAAARGEYLTLISDDDPILPGALSRLVAVLEDDDELLVAYPDWNEIDGDGRPVRIIRTREWSLIESVRLRVCIPGPCAVFRRRAVDLAGGWDTRLRYTADSDFWMRIGLHGPMRHVPEVLATWRAHAGSQTTFASRGPFAREQVTVIERFLERDDLPEEVRAVATEALATAHIVTAAILHPGALGSASSRFAVVDRIGASLTEPHPDSIVPEPTPAEAALHLGALAEQRHRELEVLRFDAQRDEARAQRLLRRIELAQGRIAELEARLDEGERG
ncbi:MAG: glycosyltransferase [Miltoncostaeaceae bacterium]